MALREPPPPCDLNVFSQGTPIALADCGMYLMEAWVRMVRETSGQPVDWHYSGGVAQVLYLGDREAVVDAIEKHRDLFPGTVLDVLPEGSQGRYRAGVTPKVTPKEELCDD